MRMRKSNSNGEASCPRPWIKSCIDIIPGVGPTYVCLEYVASTFAERKNLSNHLFEEKMRNKQMETSTHSVQNLQNFFVATTLHSCFYWERVVLP